ncbi:hypothetical protein B7588_01795 [Salmonella enterica subsp. enterica serovar Muenchen]|uniref:Uncharacterized protein n=2 Tax=Salmonella enterica TaxID=28901 RepID=A0A631E204_SALMU|nr:hypothetical protein [Salmonella enterica]EBE4007986.1 hypothetical protein [Salmonella enterica subsp. enterica serovar Muenchen]ECE9705723.1 hypothetical protein [Salmonella enterica subsp. enterica serovar Litchfield]EDQ0050797.1 hypothetical protein [Salmonella enterica subsp. enterica]EDW5052786.1 hypothetical protein [Salmonella enterica subsp. enterica serovar Hartford]
MPVSVVGVNISKIGSYTILITVSTVELSVRLFISSQCKPDNPNFKAVRDKGTIGTTYFVHLEVLRGRGPDFSASAPFF